MRARHAALVLATVLPLVASAAPPGTSPEDPAVARARRLLRDTILIDGHNDLPWEIRTAKAAPRDVAAYDLRRTTPGDTDLARLRAGGVGGQFWSVYVPGEDRADGYAKVQLEQIDIARRMIARYPEALAPALTADDVEREFRRGRIASLLGMEGGHALENSLGALRAYHDLGVRYLTLTHNVTLDWADAANDEARHGGLTPFGEEVVREMNRLGMLVDLSHTSPETMDDALRVAEAPVIFSHSSARGVCDVPRNVPDGILRRLPANGGVVMITFVAAFVSQEFADAAAPMWREYQKRTAAVTDAAERARVYEELAREIRRPPVTIGQLADHFDHVRRVAGVDHVGIGADYDGNTDWPAGLEDVSRYPYLFAELIRRGWSDEDLKKVAGANVLRALRAAEAAARRLQAVRAPSTATIGQLDR
ncbi:MAG TPA: dipeptidase [Vicinamibacteria bacterium]|nr:dipeptidase [Vicinamibacteria bacterium]